MKRLFLMFLVVWHGPITIIISRSRAIILISAAILGSLCFAF
jgi:hypothetical protein